MRKKAQNSDVKWENFRAGVVDQLREEVTTLVWTGINLVTDMPARKVISI